MIVQKRLKHVLALSIYHNGKLMKDWGHYKSFSFSRTEQEILYTFHYILKLHPNERIFTQLIRCITQLLHQIPINYHYLELFIESHVKLIIDHLKMNNFFIYLDTSRTHEKILFFFSSYFDVKIRVVSRNVRQEFYNFSHGLCAFMATVIEASPLG